MGVELCFQGLCSSHLVGELCPPFLGGEFCCPDICQTYLSRIVCLLQQLQSALVFLFLMVGQRGLGGLWEGHLMPTWW